MSDKLEPGQTIWVKGVVRAHFDAFVDVEIEDSGGLVTVSPEFIKVHHQDAIERDVLSKAATLDELLDQIAGFKEWYPPDVFPSSRHGGDATGNAGAMARHVCDVFRAAADEILARFSHEGKES